MSNISIVHGRIIKGIAGFYYVDSEDIIYECKAKGRFRNEKLKPLVGDYVDIEVLDPEKKTGNIISISKRSNELIRPAVSNISLALLVFALKDPMPSLNMLMRFFIMIRKQNVKIRIVFTKKDLCDDDTIENYQRFFDGFDTDVFLVDNKTRDGIEAVKKAISGETVVLAGPSGVGKSSLLNNLTDIDHMETGEISDKIKRGKHTTRYSQIIPMGDDTYIVDTPGFTSLYLLDMKEDEVKEYFVPFHEYEGKCRFNCCSHTHEPDCAVSQAVESGYINRDLYECYVDLYRELKEKKNY